MKIPLDVLDDMAGFATLGACLGGIAGSFTGEVAILMILGGDAGAILAVIAHIVSKG